MECLTIQKRTKFILAQFVKDCSITHANAEEFSREMLSHFQPDLPIILNCKNLNFIDSAAISTLVHIRKKILNQNGRLILANLNDRIRLLLLITRLHKVFEIHESLQAAIQTVEDDKSKKKATGNPYTIHIAVKTAPHFAVLTILKPDALIMANAKSFRAKVEEYLEKKEWIILDVDVLRNIDSEGIAALIHLKAFSKRKNKRLVVVYQNRVLKQLFELYSLDRLFRHFETVEEALAVLFPKNKQTGVSKKNSAQPPPPQYDDLKFLASMGKRKS